MKPERPTSLRLAAGQQHRERGAFTLIEVLIAVAIFSIVFLAINTVFYSALHLQTRTAQLLDDSLPVQRALASLRRDLQGTLPPGSGLVASFKNGVVGTGVGVAQGVGLEFYTTTGVINDNEPWGDIQKVTYQLADPADRLHAAGQDLVRSVTRNLLPTTTIEEPAEQWLLGNVETLEFACYDGTDWRDTWDTTMADSGLPQAIRVRLLLATTNAVSLRFRQPLEMIVPLTVQSVTNQTQTTGAEQ